MAADLRWYDQIVDRGWLRILSPAAKDVLWALSRWTDRKPMRTRASRDRVCDAVGIAPRTFRGAWVEVLRYRLVTVGEIDGRRYVYLAFPVPAVPADTARIRRYRGRISPPIRQNFAAPPGQQPRQTRRSFNGPQKTVQETTKRKDRGISVLASDLVVEAVEVVRALQGEHWNSVVASPQVLTESEPLDLDPAVWLWP